MVTVHASRIAELNDRFRRGGLGVLVTSGVREMGDLTGVLRRVREFDEFTEDNDPHGEHNFGSFVWQGQKVFWKIDYYDWSRTYGKHPLSPSCRRVLTVMLASEY